MRKSRFFSNISVILVNWNREQFFDRCLAALVVQTVTPIEITLVGNACSDGSAKITRRFPSVRLVALDESIGFSRGNNLAIETAYRKTGQIALINLDAFVAPRWLKVLLVAVESNCGLDVFGRKLVNAAYPAVLDWVGDARHVSGLVSRIVSAQVRLMVRVVTSPCIVGAPFWYCQ